MLTQEESAPEVSPELIAEVHHVALAWATPYLGHDVADDVAVEVAMNMLRRGPAHLTALRERGELKRFVVKATMNAGRSHFRSEARRAAHEAAFAAEAQQRPSFGMRPDDQCNYDDLARTVDAAVAHIGLRYGKVFRRVVEGTMTHAEIGNEFNVSARRVEWITRSRRLQIRELFADYGVKGAPVRRTKRGGGQ